MTANTDIVDIDGITKELITDCPQPVIELIETLYGELQIVKSELADYRAHNERDKADIRQDVTAVEDQQTNGELDRAKIKQRVTHLEESASESECDHGDPDATFGDTDEKTPMERIIRYSEDAAKEHLTANEERARFIAKDVTDYAKKVPAGLIIDSRTVRKVITAKEGDRPHTQTVARIMDFMADFGKDEVEVVKRRGKKLVVIDEDAAQRYHSCCDGSDATEPSRAVIQPG